MANNKIITLGELLERTGGIKITQDGSNGTGIENYCPTRKLIKNSKFGNDKGKIYTVEINNEYEYNNNDLIKEEDIIITSKSAIVSTTVISSVSKKNIKIESDNPCKNQFKLPIVPDSYENQNLVQYPIKVVLKYPEELSSKGYKRDINVSLNVESYEPRYGICRVDGLNTKTTKIALSPNDTKTLTINSSGRPIGEGLSKTYGDNSNMVGGSFLVSVEVDDIDFDDQIYTFRNTLN